MRSLTVSVISVIKSMVSLIMRPFQVTTQLGVNNISVQTTTGETKSLDAQVAAPQNPKRKPKVAQPTKQASSRKQTPNPVLAVLGQGGLQRQIRASKTSLPVKPAVKAKAARVPSIKAALLSQQGQAPVLTPTEALSGERGQLKTRASKTRQPAKAAPTKKPKAAASTTQAKKRTAKQTPAPTRTARPSKARGS